MIDLTATVRQVHLAVLTVGAVVCLGAAASPAASVTWSAPQALCDPCSRDANNAPVVAVNDSGLAMVAWTRRSELLMTERRGAAPFSAAVTLDRGERIVGVPQIAVGADGTRAVAWRAGRARSNLLVRFRRPGASWSRPSRFAGSYFDLAVGRDGTVYLVTNTGTVLVRELPAHGRWSAPTRLSAPESAKPLGGAVTVRPVIRVGTGGHLLVAWTVQEGFPQATYPRFGAAFRAPGRPWLTGETAVDSPDPMTDHEPAVGLDRSGDGLLAWRTKAGELRSVYRRRAGGWQGAQDVGPVNQDVLTPAAALQLDDAGNALVAFVGRQGHFGSVDIARRSASTGAWGASRRVSSGQRGPLDFALALGGKGVGQVVWQEVRGPRRTGMGTLSAQVSSETGRIGGIVTIAPFVRDRQTLGHVRAGASRAGAVTAAWQQPSDVAGRVAYLSARHSL